MLRRLRSSIGFTLVEILIVVVMLAILFAIAVPIYVRYVAQARAAEAQEAISSIWAASKVFNAQTGRWPTRVEQLRQLQFDTSLERKWTFTITVGGRGINTISAISTGLMAGGAGKQVTFTTETGEWRGYGTDTY